MCGIIGLHLKNESLQPRLGDLLTVMLEAMTERGPSSAGIAVYADQDRATGADGPALQYSVRSVAPVHWDLLAAAIAAETGSEVMTYRPSDDAAVMASPADETSFLNALRGLNPNVTVTGFGRAMRVVKDVGTPAKICGKFDVPRWTGYQGIGHTRMATESAVTTAHSHPFAPAADLALVHNGAFSNYATVRGKLERSGIRCETDNDSEVAARLVASHMAQGAGLDDALRHVLKEMDGFFTLLVTTRTQFAVVRDSFACKPAVIAETGDYIAMASEYQALARLPGISDAEVYEPVPEEIYVWSR